MTQANPRIYGSAIFIRSVGRIRVVSSFSSGTVHQISIDQAYKWIDIGLFTILMNVLMHKYDHFRFNHSTGSSQLRKRRVNW